MAIWDSDLLFRATLYILCLAQPGNACVRACVCVCVCEWALQREMKLSALAAPLCLYANVFGRQIMSADNIHETLHEIRHATRTAELDKCQTPSNRQTYTMFVLFSVVFVRCCSCQGTLLGAFFTLLYQDVGINVRR